jgi:hypothetical protein
VKHLVLKPFIDKETQKGYSAGDTFESNDSKRVAFLVKEGYLKGQTQAVKKNAK